MPPSSRTRLMLRLTMRNSCLPEASTYAPRQVPARSGWAAAVWVARGAAVAATAAPAITSGDGAAGASAAEAGGAGGSPQRRMRPLCVADQGAEHERRDQHGHEGHAVRS